MSPRREEYEGRLAIACPRCGRRGEVDIDRLDQPFRCGACKTRFYVDRSGQIALGQKPPESKSDQDETLVASPVASTSRLVDGWMSLPRGARIGVCVLIGLVVLYLGVQLIRGWMVPLPETLTERTIYVGQAFASGDNDALEAICLGGTQRDALAWFELMRKGRPSASAEAQSGNTPDEKGHVSQSRITAEILFETVEGAAAGSVTTVQLAGSTDPEQAVELVMFWKPDSSGTWWLDGKRTLAETGQAR